MLRLLTASIILLSFTILGNGREKHMLRYAPSHLEKDTIYWSLKPLEWKDFQGRATEGGPEKAESSTGIFYEVHEHDGRYRPTLKVFFIRTLSWKKMEDDTLLLHEQGHFDLTEIYGRRLWKELKENNLTDLTYNQIKHDQSKIHKLYEKAFHDLNKAQEEYDRETKHSIIKEEQRRWLQKIKTELESLDSYHP